MPFFRPERALSQLLRHDPFSPFIARPSFNPLSRVFDTPTHTPFCAPFITIFEDAPRHKRPHTPPPSSQATEKTGDASTQSTSSSSTSTQPQVSRGDRSSDWLERRFGRHHRGHRHFHHPLSLWSPLTSTPFPSLLNNIFTPFAPVAAAMPTMPDITLDMFSTPQAYSVHAAVPGLEKKDIKITVEDGVLTIEAERRESRPAPSTTSSSSTSTANAASQPTSDASTEEKTATANGAASTPATGSAEGQSTAASTSSASSAPASADASEDDVSFHHVESFYGKVERSVQLPEDAKVEELTAKYENGVIKIEIPRMQEVKKQGRKIEIQ